MHSVSTSEHMNREGPGLPPTGQRPSSSARRSRDFIIRQKGSLQPSGPPSLNSSQRVNLDVHAINQVRA